MVITHAPPGWGGFHHVNEQYKPYWINKLEEYGLMYNEEYTKELRNVTTMNYPEERLEWSNAFIKNTGLFFENLRFKS